MQVVQKDYLDFSRIIAAVTDTSITLQQIQIPEYDIDQTQFYFGSKAQSIVTSLSNRNIMN